MTSKPEFFDKTNFIGELQRAKRTNSGVSEVILPLKFSKTFENKTEFLKLIWSKKTLPKIALFIFFLKTRGHYYYFQMFLSQERFSFQIFRTKV